MLILHLAILFFSHVSAIDDKLCHIRSATVEQLLSDAAELTTQYAVELTDPRHYSLNFFHQRMVIGNNSLSVADTLVNRKHKGFLPVVKRSGIYYVLIPAQETPGQKLVDLDFYLYTRRLKLTNEQEAAISALSTEADSLYSVVRKKGDPKYRHYTTYIDTESGNIFINPLECADFISQIKNTRVPARTAEEKNLFRKSIHRLMYSTSDRGTFYVYIKGELVEFKIKERFPTRRDIYIIESSSESKAGLYYTVKVGHGIKREAKALIALQKDVTNFGEKLIDAWTYNTVKGELDFLVFEGQRGASLEYIGNAHVSKWKEISVFNIERILVSAYLKLREMHRAGFLFKDIKPENIIVHDDFSIDFIDFESVVRIGYSQDRLGFTPAFVPIRIRSPLVNYVTDERAELWSLAFSFLDAFDYARGRQGATISDPVTQTMDLARAERDWSGSPKLVELLKALLAQDSIDGDQSSVDKDFSLLRAWDSKYIP